MAAIQRSGTSSVGATLVVAVAGSLLVGVSAGYTLKGLTSPAAGPAAQGVQHHGVEAAEMPAWVEKYVSPENTQQFKVDEYLENLSYVEAAEMPAWAQKYVTPEQAPQFKVDEYLESLSYAKAAPIVDNEQVGFTQQ